MSEVLQKGKSAKAASFMMVGISTEEKNEALAKIADQLLVDQEFILEENKKDLEAGRKNGLSESVLDRIMLNEKRILDMAEAIRLLITLKDPVGETLETIHK
ncbi:gamma-glutamyl-phosphate reductase, partial [Shouchella clausii]